MNEVPEEVRALLAERAERRAAKDFAAADAIRDRMADLGFRVVDGPEGQSLEPLAGAPPEGPGRAADVASVLLEPATADVTVHWVVEGWAEDARRALDAFRDLEGGRVMQYVLVDLTEGDEDFGDDVEVLRLEPATGWASARNAGLRRSRGQVVIAMDGSIEPTGEMLGPLERTLADPTVGLCGPFGLTTRDLREFAESRGPEVDAIEGYRMAFRRELLTEVGAFDEKFRWYRTADIELSFRVKDAGYRCVVVEVPVRKHEHRMWQTTEPAERDRLSKRNFYRFLERFRGRTDLLVDAPEG